jgi:hypothetical protein
MQTSFSDLDCGAKKKLTRRAGYLGEIQAVTLSLALALAAMNEPHSPGAMGEGARRRVSSVCCA